MTEKTIEKITVLARQNLPIIIIAVAAVIIFIIVLKLISGRGKKEKDNISDSMDEESYEESIKDAERRQTRMNNRNAHGISQDVPQETIRVSKADLMPDEYSDDGEKAKKEKKHKKAEQTAETEEKDRKSPEKAESLSDRNKKKANRKEKEQKQDKQKERQEKGQNADSSVSQYSEAYEKQSELQTEYHDEMEILKKFGI